MTLAELEAELATAKRELGALPPSLPHLYPILGDELVRGLVAFRALIQRVADLEGEIAKRRPANPTTAA